MEIFLGSCLPAFLKHPWRAVADHGDVIGVLEYVAKLRLQKKKSNESGLIFAD